MSDIKRYDKVHFVDANGKSAMVQRTDGKWVRYADLAAAEQKHAALVDAVKKGIFSYETCPFCYAKTKVGGHSSKCPLTLAALAQQDQPAGEWITINEDGSNLPEQVEGAKWWIYDDRYPSDVPIRTDLEPEFWCNRPVVRYWSVPDIVKSWVFSRRPDIPEYTAR